MGFALGWGVGFFYLVLLPFVLLVVWAMLDALVRPESQWGAADQSKTAWVLAMVIGTSGLGPVGIVVALVYLMGIRPRLMDAARIPASGRPAA